MANFDLNNYETVEARLKRFWEDHPTGAVITDICGVTPDHKSVIIRAQVWFDKADTIPTGVGIAQESQGGNGPNSTSWTENCDTSAVGRALARSDAAPNQPRLPGSLTIAPATTRRRTGLPRAQPPPTLRQWSAIRSAKTRTIHDDIPSVQSF
jgi:hypothetical protein